MYLSNAVAEFCQKFIFLHIGLSQGFVFNMHSLPWSCSCTELLSQQWCSGPKQTAVLHEIFCKSFKNFHHFEGFSYTTKYLLQNHFYIALNSFEVQIHVNYHLCWLEWRKFKKTNQEGQRPGSRSVCVTCLKGKEG